MKNLVLQFRHMKDRKLNLALVTLIKELDKTAIPLSVKLLTSEKVRNEALVEIAIEVRRKSVLNKTWTNRQETILKKLITPELFNAATKAHAWTLVF